MASPYFRNLRKLEAAVRKARDECTAALERLEAAEAAGEPFDYLQANFSRTWAEQQALQRALALASDPRNRPKPRRRQIIYDGEGRAHVVTGSRLVDGVRVPTVKPLAQGKPQ